MFRKIFRNGKCDYRSYIRNTAYAKRRNIGATNHETTGKLIEKSMVCICISVFKFVLVV